MAIEDLDRQQILSDIARDILDDVPDRPPYAEGWRSVRELCEETGKTEAVIRQILERKLKSGEYEVVRSHPYCYRKVP